MRFRLLVVELVLYALAVAIAWWLAGTATTAWLTRVARLHVALPGSDVHGLATRAAVYFTVGVSAIAVGRGARELVDARRRSEPINVPWLLPAVVAASLLGLAVHLATLEVVQGRALTPTALPFAQGFAIGGVAAAIVLVVPVDLAELATRAQLPIALVVTAIFAALAIAGTGPAGSGTKINLGPVQPIEIVKPLVVAFLAAYLGTRAPKLRWQRRRILGLRWPRLELLAPAVGALVAIVGGLYVIGDLGPVLLLALGFLGMFFVASRATGWVVVAFAVLAAVLVVFAHAPHLAGHGAVQTRLVMWTDPWTNAMTNGSQLGEGLWAIAAGGWDGQGMARGLTPIVPAGKTDLVLATLAEQLGARALVAYHLLLAAIVLGALSVAMRSRTAVRVLMASGIAVLVLAQWLVILCGTLGKLPLTGIVVPFVSAGRSSMAVFMVMAALVVRLGSDGRMRVASTELDELHGAARGVKLATVVLAGFAIFASVLAAVTGRADTSARSIRVRLADGTLIERRNPRLVAIAERIRRGSILDRDGAPLAISGATGRRYPLGDALGTLLGFAPAKVLLPPWALERVHDDDLRGWTDMRGFVDLLDLDDGARDRAIAALDADVAQRSVKLTIDGKLQAKVAQLLRAATAKHVAAAAVVIDVETGEVLARVQVPDYDPNAPAWQAHVLANDGGALARLYGAYGTWPDKTGVQGMFQAGSVGKLVTALAAVREDRAGARFACKDSDAQGPLFALPSWPKPIHDHTGDRVHGTPDLVEALAVSCNVYFAQLGLALGAEPFTQLRKAGVDVGYGGPFEPGAAGTRQLASTAFGQGAMVMSVMQAARLVAAIAAGGTYVRCPPTMELGARCTRTAIVDDPRAVSPIILGMRRVMTHGTGARLIVPPGVRVYGKTGTADVRGFAGEEPFGIARAQVAPPHSWFVGFAEPAAEVEASASTPGRIAVAVVIPRGGTGAAAAGPVAMQVIAATAELGYLKP